MRAGKAQREAQYSMYGQTLQRRRRAFCTQPVGDRAILTQGFVADRLCSDGYTALAAAP
jgi:hypothetical protein